MSLTASPTRRWLPASIGIALLVYALLWLGYTRHWSGLDALDAAALNPAHAQGIGHPGWVTAWDVFCTVFGPNAFRLAVAVIVIVLLVRRQPRVAAFLVITVELSGLVTAAAKLLVDRPRPSTALVYAYGTSFPSGHAVGTLVGVLALLAVFVPMTRPGLRPWLGVLGAALIIGIGVGRVMLNVHHPTDVLAGWVLGYAYFAACLLVFPPRPLRAVDEAQPAPGTAP